MEIFVNGISEGIAARGIPLPTDENQIWAVIDMYGACQQISVQNQQCEHHPEGIAARGITLPRPSRLPTNETDWVLPEDIQQQEVESDGQGSMVSTDFTCQTDFTSSGKPVRKYSQLSNTKIVILSIIRSFTWEKFRILESIAKSWLQQFC